VTKPEGIDKPPVWVQQFIPVVFDRIAATGQWFVVATFDTCEQWQELGRPKFPYTEFRVVSGKWVQQALAIEHNGHAANMLTSIKSSGEEDLSLAAKTTRMRNPAIDQTFREVTDKWVHGC